MYARLLAVKVNQALEIHAQLLITKWGSPLLLYITEFVGHLSSNSY